MPLNDAVNEGASNYNSESESMMEKEEKDASAKHETLRDTLNHVILAQQSALEILTNLCCDDSNYEDCSETDDDEDDMNGNLNKAVFLLILLFIYSEKATQFCEISTIDLSYVVTVKSTVEILQNFVVFSEYMNFKLNKAVFLLIL